MPNDELLLVDLSSIAYPIFHMTSSSDANATSTQIVDRVRALSSDHLHAAICCDSGRSFRYDLDTTYKAHRPEQDAVLHHQIALACETLARDGYPIWSVKGYEADDLIASATKRALAIADTTVLIASADKDLLQLVNDRVQVKSLKDGARLDATWVQEKFGVPPAQMRDYLTLVGDSSDNVKGAFQIGPKKAAALLAQFGSVAALMDALATPVPGATKLARGITESLTEFASRWQTVQQLVTLAEDVPIPFEEVAAERVPLDAQDDVETYDEPLDDDEEEPVPTPAPVLDAVIDALDPRQPPTKKEPARAPEMDASLDAKSTALAVTPAPAEWDKQLEPRSMSDAWKLASAMHRARLFAGYGTPEAVLSTVLAGRELGFNAIASLRAFHIIDGKHSLAADAMRGLVLRSGAAKYFRIVERTADHCTWETWRHGDPEPIRLTYTIAQSRAAWQKDERAWNNGPYTKNPEDMLSARASSKLARLVYADILFALYAPSELSDTYTE